MPQGGTRLSCVLREWPGRAAVGCGCCRGGPGLRGPDKLSLSPVEEFQEFSWAHHWPGFNDPFPAPPRHPSPCCQRLPRRHSLRALGPRPLAHTNEQRTGTAGAPTWPCAKAAPCCALQHRVGVLMHRAPSSGHPLPLHGHNCGAEEPRNPKEQGGARRSSTLAVWL